MPADQRLPRLLYRKLVALYPRTFRDQLGESMEQTFNDIWSERKRARRGWLGVVLWIFVETAMGVVWEHMRALSQGNAMRNLLTHPRSRVIVGLVLTLPGAILVWLSVLGAEPPLGAVASRLVVPDDRPDVLGSAIALGLMLLLPAAALALNLAPLVRNIRAGNGLAASPASLVLVIGTLLIIALVAAGLIIDQYPCWVGVPNCD